MLLLLEPSNVVLVVSLYSVVGWLGGGCECYACGDGVEVARDERCRDYAGGIVAGMSWCGVAWFVRYGVVWCGVVRKVCRGGVWCGVVQKTIMRWAARGHARGRSM